MANAVVGAVAAAIALLAGCDSKDRDYGGGGSSGDMVEEASVDWARKQVPELDTQLASSDPGQASSTCAVIKPDMAAIKRADPKLAKTIEQRCGRDLALRSLAVYVERAEVERKADPNARLGMECTGWDIYMKSVIREGAANDPEVGKLRTRFSAACPGKP